MALKSGVSVSSIYDGSKVNELKEQRKVEEEIPLAKRIANSKHEQARHVRGGKVFTLNTGNNKKGTPETKISKKISNEFLEIIRKILKVKNSKILKTLKIDKFDNLKIRKNLKIQKLKI